MNVVYTHQARDDLHRIYEYISLILLSPDSAANTVSKIMASVNSLESMPERNPLYKTEPWKSKGIRFSLARNYLIFYAIDTETDTVSIIRIIYGQRDISKQLENTEWK